MPVSRLFTLLPLLALAPMTAAEARNVTIHNRTGDVLRGIYLSPPGDDHWGPDRVRENVRIRGKLAVPLPGPGCRWDVRVLLGGRPAEQIYRNRDLCAQPVLAVDGKTKVFDRGRDTPVWN